MDADNNGYCKRVREALKPRLREYVEMVTERSKRGMYTCPLCGSGNRAGKTGALSIDGAGTHCRCFSCGWHGDIFDLIGAVEGIAEPAAQVRRAVDIFSGGDASSLYGRANAGQRNDERFGGADEPPDEPPADEPADYLGYYRRCVGNLPRTDYLRRRGISDETARRYLVGYDAQYNAGQGRTWRAVILPTSRQSFEARNTDGRAGTADRYRKTGRAQIFNARALSGGKPVFVVEGIIDALSIIEAGGQAVALGSAANAGNLVKWVRDNGKPGCPLILCLDGDTAGRDAEKKLAGELPGLGIIPLRADIYAGEKDANAALMKDRGQFIMAVTETAKQAAEMAKAQAAEPPADGQAKSPAEEARDKYVAESCAGTYLPGFIDGIRAKHDAPIPTGLAGLDRILDGGLYPGLYVLGAVTSTGKTSLALQIMDTIAASGRDVLIISLEMSRSELMAKTISRLTVAETLQRGGNVDMCGKSVRDILVGSRYDNYTQQELSVINGAVNRYAQFAAHVYVVEGRMGYSAADVRSAVQRHKGACGCAPVVCVDYMQILAPPARGMTDKQGVDDNVVELRQMARDFGTPVIAISSFNRQSYDDADIDAFKESGNIEYSGDILLILRYRNPDKSGKTKVDIDKAKADNPRHVEVVIKKDRSGGGAGSAQLNYYSKYNLFEE